MTECGTEPTDGDYVVKVSPEIVRPTARALPSLPRVSLTLSTRPQYGSTSGASSVCGTWITLYQLEKDAYTRATSASRTLSLSPRPFRRLSRADLTSSRACSPAVEGVCPECTGHNLILSQATFNALTQDMKLGTTLAQFWLTDDAHKPKASLSSAATGADATDRVSASAGGGEGDEDDEGGRFTTLPVETDRAVAANGAASMGV